MADVEVVRLRTKLQKERACYWLIILALLVALGFIIFGENQCAIQVEGKGTVWVTSWKSARRVEKALRDQFILQTRQKFGDRVARTLRFKETIMISRRQTEGPPAISETEALHRLRAMVTPQVKGAAIYVAGALTVGLPNKRMAQETIDAIKLKKVQGDPAKAAKAEIVGGTRIEEQYIDLQRMRPTVADAVAWFHIEAGPLAAPPPSPSGGRTYTVVSGDTGTRIAQKLQMPLSELERLNPSVDWTRLQVGQTLNVGVAQTAPPQPDASMPATRTALSPAPGKQPAKSGPEVRTVAVETVKEIIPYGTRRRHSLKLHPGQEVVVRKGQKGWREVRYQVTWEGGRRVSRKEISRKTLREAVDEEILTGSSP